MVNVIALDIEFGVKADKHRASGAKPFDGTATSVLSQMGLHAKAPDAQLRKVRIRKRENVLPASIDFVPATGEITGFKSIGKQNPGLPGDAGIGFEFARQAGA